MTAARRRVGTLTADAVSFATGSNFDVEIDSLGNSDMLVASGNVAIQSGASLKISAENLGEDGSTYDWTTQYQIIAANSVIGEFETVSYSFAFLDASVFYDTGDVYLTMTRNDVDFSDVAQTFNQIATAAAISELGSGTAIYDTIILLDTTEAPHAFDQFSGEIHPTASTLVAQNSLLALGVAQRREGGSGSQVWGEVIGNWAQISGDGNAATASQYVFGQFAGAGFRLSGNMDVGVMLGISNASFDVLERSSSGSTDAIHVGGYRFA